MERWRGHARPLRAIGRCSEFPARISWVLSYSHQLLRLQFPGKNSWVSKSECLSCCSSKSGTGRIFSLEDLLVGGALSVHVELN